MNIRKNEKFEALKPGRFAEDYSSPIAQIARFDAWNDLRNFEMAYLPGKNDYLQWSLTNDYKAPPYGVPYINGIDGPLYGRNTIPIENVMQCNPYVNSCLHEKSKTASQFLGRYTQK